MLRQPSQDCVGAGSGAYPKNAPPLPDLLSSALQRGRILLPTSFCAETREVAGMVERPDWETILYEFLQNQLDAFRNMLERMFSGGTPLLGEIPEGLMPRTWLVRNAARGERREMFLGNGDCLYEGDPVARLEFEDFGPGLSPEHVLGMKHGSGESALGMFGRGFKVGGTVLGAHGMRLLLSSHVNGVAWEGHTSLEPLTTFLRFAAANDPAMVELVETLKLDSRFFTLNFGAAAAPPSRPRTIVAIENPSVEVLRALANMPKRFLYMNPEYPGACLVPVTPKARGRRLREVPLRGGRLVNLEGVPGLIEPEAHQRFCGIDLEEGEGASPEGASRRHTRLYVDGLALPLDSYAHPRSLVPWLIEGLGREKDFARVARSSDSRSIEASDLAFVVAATLRQIDDPELWETLLRRALEYPNIPCLEFFFQPPDWDDTRKKLPGFGRGVAERVREVWDAVYPDSLICKDKGKLETYAKLFSKQRMVLVTGGLYFFLDSAGVPTVEKSSGEKAYIGMAPRRFRFRSIKDPEAIYRIIKDLIYEGGSVTFENEKPPSVLKATFPIPFYQKEEFDNDGDGSSGKLLTMMAAFAGRHGLTMNCFALDENHLYRIFFEATPYGDDMQIGCQIVVFERPKTPEYEGLEAGRTYVELTGPLIDQLEMSRTGDEFQEALKAFQDRLKGLPAFRESPEQAQAELERRGVGMEGLRNTLFLLMNLFGYDVRDLRTATREGGPLDEILVENEGLGSAGSDPETFMRHLRSVEGLILEESRMPPGMYVQTRGTRFAYNALLRRGSWVAPSARQEIPLKDLPELEEADDFPSSPRIVLDGSAGERALMVPSSHDIVAFKVLPTTAKKGVRLYRNAMTGCYALAVATNCPLSRFIYYTAPATVPWNLRPPLEEEYENEVKDEDLPPGKAGILAQLRTVSDLPSRAVKTQMSWANGFCYSNDPALDKQGVGDSVAQVAAQILNVSAGNCLPCAAGGVLYDRAAGMASRFCAGYLIHADGSIGPHASKETCVGNQWIETDPQAPGVGTVRDAERPYARPGMVETKVAPMRPAGSTVDAVGAESDRAVKQGKSLQKKSMMPPPPSPSHWQTRTRMALLFATAVATGAAGFLALRRDDPAHAHEAIGETVCPCVCPESEAEEPLK